MKSVKIILITLIILNLVAQTIYAQSNSEQNQIIDSIRQVIKTAKHDTTRINAFLTWGEQVYLNNPDTALILWENAHTVAKDFLAIRPPAHIADTAKKYLAATLNNIGSFYKNKGDFPNALEYYNNSIKIQEEIGNKKGIATSFNNIGVIYNSLGDIAKAIEYHNKSLKIKKEIGDKKGMAGSFINMGMIYYNQGDISKALESYKKSLNIYEEFGDKKGMAYSFNNIGMIFKNRGDISMALEYYNKCLKIQEEISDKKGMASSFINFGVIYYNQDDIQKALEYNNKAYKILAEIDDRKGMASSLNNIGAIYCDLSEAQTNPYQKEELLKKALECYNKCLKIQEEIGNKMGIALTLYNIGMIYDDNGDISTALDYYIKSLKIKEEIGDKKGMALSFNNIGSVYFEKNDVNNAKIYVEKSYKLSKELGYPENIEDAARWLKKINEKQGNYKKAYEYYKEEIQMHDSIQNEENYKETQKQQAKYEYEKKAATDSISNAKAMEIKNIELSRSEEVKKKQRVVIYSFIIGFLIILIFSIIIYRLFLQKKLANVILFQQKEEISAQRDEIETQRDLVTEQKEHIEKIHKEVTDSINYAERIQRSFLATKELLDNNLNSSFRGIASPEFISGKQSLSTPPSLRGTKQSFEDETNYFVFFKPKDVVSGDFYWAVKLHNGNFAFATADSTGHGVPGAIMSILNISSLEKAIESGICEPSEILNHTRKTIIERLKKDGSPEGGKDGMDASLICFDFENLKLTYSAANNPIWIIREKDLIELVHDKMPIGKHDKDQISFTQHEFQLQKGDVIYTLTDGFPDQFGGPKGKKFMTKNLKQLLIAHCQLSMEEQKQIIEKTLVDWIGDGEQIDDITILGIKI